MDIADMLPDTEPIEGQRTDSRELVDTAVRDLQKWFIFLRIRMD